MKALLLFIAAQLAGNGITLIFAALTVHSLRRRLVAARPVDLGAYSPGYSEASHAASVGTYAVGAPC